MSEPTQPAAPAAPAVDPLRAAVERLAENRAAHGMMKLQRERSYAKWEEQHAELIKGVAATASLVSDAEATVRTLALKRMKETGDNKPGPGLLVKMEKQLSYEEADALAWAVKTGTALKLDTKAFDAIARAAAAPLFPGLKVEVVPKVTIATDLLKALALSEVTAPEGAKPDENAT